MEGNHPEIMPKHVAIIMDGNNRWAKKKISQAFQATKKVLKELEGLSNLQLKKELSVLTLFAFSSENWGRSSDEVNLLMKLLYTAP